MNPRGETALSALSREGAEKKPQVDMLLQK